MWIVRIALRRPYTFIVAALVIVLMTPIVLQRTPTDVFPNIDIPVVSICWNYAGLSPQLMEDRIVSPYERFMTTVVDNIEHTESQTVAGRSVIKVFFQPGTDVHVAVTQITAISQTMIRQLPPGISPPLIITYSASSVPVLQLGMSGQGLSEQELFDFGANLVRNQLATVAGAAIPWPFGGKQRQVSVNIDIPALQSKGLSPVDVITAITTQNLVLPSGTVKMGSTEFNVEMNGSPDTIAALNNLPIKTANGATIYVKDVAYVSDGFSPQINIARMDGQRGVILAIYKTGDTSTLDVVSQVYAKLPQIKNLLPPQTVITPLFDQSIFVRAAIQGVVREGVVAACLTALMILLFLGSWRSTLIIAISIPLSILVSITVLSALHETINLMTLGGLALAVGILVDDATVAIENIESKPRPGKGNHSGDSGRRAANCRAGVGLHAFDLHRVRAHVLPDRRGEISVRAAGGSRGLRHAGLLPPVANSGADDGHVPPQGTSRRGTRHRERYFLASAARIRARVRPHARRLSRVAVLLPRARLAFYGFVSRFLRGFPGPDSGAGPGLLSQPWTPG